MSWQRIFEVARERKLPIIVTDLAGREPMVVMPLEEYERMGEQPKTIPIKMEKEEQIPLPKESPVVPPNPGVIEDVLSLEERFYLEPMDEESNI